MNYSPPSLIQLREGGIFMSYLKIFAKTIAIPLGLGILISFLLRKSFQYDNLIQPNLAPPAILFPIVWTILYTLMGVSYGILTVKQLVDEEVNRMYYAQLIVNLVWPILFFGLEYRLLAFVTILLLDILVVLMIVTFYRKNQLAGLLQVPYLIWLLFATYLNYQIYWLNG